MNKYAVAFRHNEVDTVDVVTEYIDDGNYRLRTWDSYTCADDFAVSCQDKNPRYTYWVISLEEVNG